MASTLRAFGVDKSGKDSCLQVHNFQVIAMVKRVGISEEDRKGRVGI
jgi:hypothetical protein